MPGSERRRRPEARPQEILEAALALFAERGFAATRLDDVAARAGLSKAAIYLYFADKEALLAALVRTEAEANLERIRAVLGEPGRPGAGAPTADAAPPVDGAPPADGKRQLARPSAPRLAALLDTLAERIARTALPDLVKLVLTEARARPEIGRLWLDTVIRPALALVERLIGDAVASGELRPVDPALAARCVVAPMLLAALWRSALEPLGAEPLDPRALARQHARILLDGLRAGPPTAAPEPLP